MKNITLIILIFSGIILFAFSGYANQEHHSQSKFNSTQQQEMLQQQSLIQLSDSQKLTLRQKKLEHHKKLIRLFAEIEVTQLEQTQLEFADPVQESAVKQNIEKFNDLRKDIDLERWTIRKEFRAVLTPEQLQKLKVHHTAIVQGLMGQSMMSGMMGQSMMSGMMGQSMMSAMMGQGQCGQQDMMQNQGMMQEQGQGSMTAPQDMMQGQEQNMMDAPTQ